MSDGYHETRLEADARRSTVWKALWRYYFRHHIDGGDTVLDLGAGYGDFINAVVAKRRIAIDAWPGLHRSAAAGVEAITSSVTDLSMLEMASIDYAFASNLFEHLTKDEILATLAQLKKLLTAKGQLALLQPNYRYAYKEYFDDYTHVSIFSHVSIADFLTANGWDVTYVHPRFLPLTVKSRLPVFPMLIRLYLSLPYRPLGKQMLIVARPRKP